jgi:prophage antirepressor-like protein
MKTNIQIFNNPQFGNIRIAKNEQGEPIFCLPDLCNVLGLSNTSRVKDRLDDGVTLSYPISDNLGRLQDTTFVTEPGFYDVVIRSDSPKAKPFRNWITGEVLPDIRKHGAYATPATIDAIISDPEFGIKLLSTLKEERAKTSALQQRTQILEGENQLLTNEVKQLAPKAEYTDTVLQSVSTCTMTQVAKELGMSAVALEKKLHAKGIMFKQSGQWLLYAKYQTSGYTCARTHHFRHSDGSVGTSTVTVWTEAGRHFIHKVIGSETTCETAGK